MHITSDIELSEAVCTPGVTSSQLVQSSSEKDMSGASLQRPELLLLLDDAAPGDIILIEQVDRLSRLDEDGWQKLKHLIQDKRLVVASLDLPTSHMALTPNAPDEFTLVMLKAINGMMLDMLADIARKDYSDRRRRQEEGITKAKVTGKFKGRQADRLLHEKIIELRIKMAKVSGIQQGSLLYLKEQLYGS